MFVNGRTFTNTFANCERLHAANQFQRIFDQATKSKSDSFTLLSRENTAGYPRLGIVIAKRNVKRAVDRNLIKRNIRESFRLNKIRLPPNDFIVIVKQPCRHKQRGAIRKQLTNLWKSSAVT